MKQLSRREIKSMAKPWITTAIKASIHVKNILFRKYLKSKSEYYHSKYKMYRNKLNHLININKRQYYGNYFTENLGNIKNIWKGITHIITLKPQNLTFPPKLVKPLSKPIMTIWINLNLTLYTCLLLPPRKLNMKSQNLSLSNQLNPLVFPSKFFSS